jgi:predicted transcriptional regulator
MKLPCELMVEKLPVLRSLITNEIVNNFGLTQKQAAKKLGITQPAVSQYLKGSRGRKNLADKKLRTEARRIAKEIMEGKNEFPKGVCSICGCPR